MSYDYEKLLISKILYSNNISPIVNRKIDETLFQNEECKKVIKWLLDFQRKYTGEVPSIELFEKEFPDFRLEYAKDPHDFYIDKIVENYISVSSQEAVMKWIKELVTNPNEGLEGLRSDLTQIELTTNPTEDMILNDTIEERLKSYLDRKNCSGIDGLRTPWEELDEATGGIHGGESWGIVARPGIGKTWLLNLFGVNLFEQGQTILITTKEMPPQQMARRWDSAYFKLPFQRFRDGTLNDAQFKKYEEGLKQLTKEKNSVIITTADTLSAITSKAIQYKADVILIDGAYLLTDEMGGKSTWERTTNISRGIKQIGLSLNKPILHTWQLNRAGAGKDVGTEHIGLTDAVSQDNICSTALVLTDRGYKMAKNLDGHIFNVYDGERVKKAICRQTQSKKQQEIHFRGKKLVKSPDHRLYVYDNEVRDFAWKFAKDIEPLNDFLIERAVPTYGGLDHVIKVESGRGTKEITIPTNATEELGRLIGYMIGNGSIRPYYKGQVVLCCGYDEELAKESLILMRKIFGIQGVVSRAKTKLSKGKQISVTWYSRGLSDWFRFFIEPDGHKTIRYGFSELNYQFRLGLLAGLMQTDGSFIGTPEFVTSEPTSAEGFMKLCTTMGLMTRHRFTPNKTKGKHRVRMVSRELKKIPLKLVGKKKKDFENLSSKINCTERVPSSYVEDLCRSIQVTKDTPQKIKDLVYKGRSHKTMSIDSIRLLENYVGIPLMNEYRFIQVEDNILNDEEVEMYSVQVYDSDKSLIVDGFIDHNCDVVVAIQGSKDMLRNNERKINTLKCREGQPPEFLISFDLDNVDFQALANVDVKFEDDEVIKF